jgi:hypothetical protein
MRKVIRWLVGTALSILVVGIVLKMLSGERVPVSEMETSATASDGQFISWVEHRIDDQDIAGGTKLRGADGLEIADLDQDGNLDILSVHEDSNHVRLAFGTEDSDHWELVTLAEGKIVDGAEDPAIGDVNGDGWLDLIVACEGGNIVYFQNPGIGVRDAGNWQVIVPDLSQDRGSWIRVFLADLGNDGTLEAVVTNKSIKMHGGFGSMDVPASPVSWLDIPGNPLEANAWRENELGRFIVPVNGRPVDLDGDGDIDILAGSRGESRMIFFENQGQNPAEFKQYPVNVRNRSVPETPRLPKKLSGMALFFEDINKDGRLDIITFETPWSIVWLEQPVEITSRWIIHPMTESFPDSPTALSMVDINGDGMLDLFSGGYSQDPREEDAAGYNMFHRAGGLFWLEQVEDGKNNWVRHDISRRMRGMFDAFIPMDLNRDGLIDFIGTRGNSGKFDGVFWLEQRRSKVAGKVFQQARKEDSLQLPPPPFWMQWLSRQLLQ